jgi:drug/metabolite transporter (DMT)-like permease
LAQARTKHFLILLLLALTWGSSFILMKRGMRDEFDQMVFAPNQVASLRLTLAGLALLPISLSAIRHIKKEDWKWLSVVGLVGSGIPAFLFTNSQRYLDSSVAGILNSLTPLFTLIVGMAIFKKVMAPRQVVGVLIGLAGAGCLISLKGFGSSENWGYSLLIVLATFSYGLSVNTVQNKIPHLKSLHITSLSLLIAGIPCGIYAVYSGVPHVIMEHNSGWKSFGYILILAMAGTAMANMLYFYLTIQTSALFASSVTYIMPLVAVAWGVFDGESLSIYHVLCSAIILTGVWLVNAPRLKTAKK